MGSSIQLEFKCDQVRPEDMVDGKMHCAQCNKQVLDARSWSVEELGFRLKKAGGTMCLSVTEAQFQDESLELAIVHAVPRRLRFWEIFLLSLCFAFGLATSVNAQSLSIADAEAIQAIYAGYDAACQTYGDEEMRYGGAIVRDPDTLDWDSLALIDRINFAGREIIILNQPIFFSPEGSTYFTPSATDTLVPEIARQQATVFKSMEIILDFPWKTIMVYGHADPDEPGDKQALSLARGNFVVAELRKWGIRNKIVVKAMGTKQPDQDTPFQDYEGKDRRVRIILVERGQE